MEGGGEIILKDDTCTPHIVDLIFILSIFADQNCRRKKDISNANFELHIIGCQVGEE